ncbi:MAG: metallophosphoesterase family protein [Alphaproteobacteria bacterium]|nr:metallophosphoesterase family protein [Alphaproteobacteria bacterium]
MLRRLFGKTDTSSKPPATPEDTCLYAIGDVHGRADLLASLLEDIRADAARRSASRKLVVMLGDYVDRGQDSKGVLDILIKGQKEGLGDGLDVVCLMGNHEDLMLQFLENAEDGAVWIMNGGDAAMRSYGVNVPAIPQEADPLDLQAEFTRKLPDEHLDFLRTLKPCHEEGDYLFVHAGVRPGIPLKRQEPEDMMWIRDIFLESTRDHGKVVVHGHSVRFQPEEFPENAVRPSRIGIDTGAYMTDSLTCLALDGEERSLIRTQPNARFATGS